MKLYFGNWVATVTTLMLLGLVGFIVCTFMHREGIEFWGRRTLFLSVFGLLICCFASGRDGLDKTIQYTIDKSCNPGIFELVSIPNIVGCIGALLIIVAGVATLFCHKQNIKEVFFFIMSGGVMMKIVTVEVARIMTLF